MTAVPVPAPVAEIRAFDKDRWLVRAGADWAEIAVVAGAQDTHLGPWGFASVSCRTSQGQFSLAWPSLGLNDWRNKASKVGRDELMTQFMGKGWMVHDLEATQAAVKAHMIDEWGTKSERAQLLARVHDEAVAEAALDDRGEDFATETYLVNVDSFVEDAWDHIAHKPDAKGLAFYERLWQPFVAEMKLQLEAERQAAAEAARVAEAAPEMDDTPAFA